MYMLLRACTLECFSAKIITMIIPIKRDPNIQEWAIVELQGELSFSSKDITNSHYIGDLHFTKSGTPILIIGIHILHGKEMALAKPIAVLKKKSTILTNEIRKQDYKIEYDIQAIVKKKIVFKVRPKPIITNVSRT